MGRTPSFSNTRQQWPGRLASSLLLFIYGWREVFVPLVVLVHNQHGPSLALAGIAVAAARVGAWLLTATSLRRPPAEAGVLAGMALLLLGLAPEEGPVSVLLWFVFGLGLAFLSRAVMDGVAGHHRAQTLPGGAALLLGMALAAPLALGPGSWLAAAICFLLAWQLKRGQSANVAGKSDPAEAHALRRDDLTLGARQFLRTSRWLPFLFSLVYLLWVWLVPARLVQWGVSPLWFGPMLAASWLARLAVPTLLRRPLGRIVRTAAALLLALVAGTLAVAELPWVLALLLVLHGSLMGLVATHPALARPERGQLPQQFQSLGEVLGPLAGVVLVLAGGWPAVLVAAALAGGLLAMALWLDRTVTGWTEGGTFKVG